MKPLLWSKGWTPRAEKLSGVTPMGVVEMEFFQEALFLPPPGAMQMPPPQVPLSHYRLVLGGVEVLSADVDYLRRLASGYCNYYMKYFTPAAVEAFMTAMSPKETSRKKEEAQDAAETQEPVDVAGGGADAAPASPEAGADA